MHTESVDAFTRLKQVLGDVPVIHDQELGAVDSKWSLSYDPLTGIIMIVVREDLFFHPKEIDHVGSAVQMHLHNIRVKLGTAGL